MSNSILYAPIIQKTGVIKNFENGIESKMLKTAEIKSIITILKACQQESCMFLKPIALRIAIPLFYLVIKLFTISTVTSILIQKTMQSIRFLTPLICSVIFPIMAVI